MSTYDILQNETDPDRLSQSASCVVAIYRYKWPSTYSRKTNASFSLNPRLAHETRAKIIIVDDIISAATNHGKNNYVSTLNLVLQPGLNYVSEILPGDHIFCWMTQDKESAYSIVERLKNGDPCNAFDDGLKFYGRIQESRKRMVQAPGGTRQTRFTVTAAGFLELDASVFYDPMFQLAVPGMGAGWLRYYGEQISKLLSSSSDGVQSDKMISALVKIFYGNGIRTNLGLAEVSTTAGTDNPNSLVIPTPVAEVFGVSTGSKPDGQVGWIDIMELVHGIQSFYDGPDVVNVDNRGRLFNPRIHDSDGRNRFTGEYLQGTFTPQPVAMSGQKSVMSLIQQYLNMAINEVYSSLRVNKEGKIMPTLTVRQLPFSSGMISRTYYPPNNDNTKNKKITPRPPQPIDIPLTRFAELPRWKIHPVLVKSFEVGRSDALRFNYVHIYPEAGYKTGVHPVDPYVRDRPIRDDLDIMRSGLRIYQKTVACGQKDLAVRAGGRWMYLMSDILMSQHLTLTGGIELHGIQAPIVSGDNIEYDGVIAHIENVSHHFSKSQEGNTSFTTSLRLTHGMTGEQLAGTDNSMHSGITPESTTGLDPAVSRDSENQLPNATNLGSRDELEFQLGIQQIESVLDDSEV